MKNTAGFFIACLSIAFFIFITMRGELSRYINLVTGANTL